MARRRFRGAKRRSFWTGFDDELSFATGSGDGSLTLASDATIADIDPAPTLVRIVGVAIWRALRTNSGIMPGSTETESVRIYWGIMCQEPASTQFTDPSTAAGLGDERWMHTRADQLHAPARAQAYWNGSTRIDVWTPVHAAPYPRVHQFDIRAKRKFEDPCNLVFHAASQDLDNDFEAVHVQVTCRMLWLAS